MALKAKHQHVIYERIMLKLGKGKSISEERRLLATMDENMKFKGCPTDRNYARKIGRPLHLLKTQAYQSNQSHHPLEAKKLNDQAEKSIVKATTTTSVTVKATETNQE